MIVFISNYLNHHQVNICKELSKRDKFYFIASERISEERVRLGYADMNCQYDFVVRIYDSDEQRAFAQKLLNEADVVIAGSCAFPFEMIVPRLKKDQLTFWFSERLFKFSWLELFYPSKLKRVLTQCTRYRKNKNFYLLCAGGYVAKDYKWYNVFQGKSFSWGYFPECVIKREGELFEKKQNDKLHLLWAGRYIKLKRPKYAIYAAECLCKAGIDFEIKMVGNGKLYDRIGKLVAKKKLDNHIILTGAMPYSEVREEMDKADIFIFTSTRREGWGAVINESMNSGCAIIADKHIGSAKSMIDDGVNGNVFSNKRQFKKILLRLAKDKALIRNMGENAYDTIVEMWTATKAADRFYKIADDLRAGKNICIYENGPMTLV